MGMSSFHIRIAGEPVCIETDHPGYLTFLQEYFRAAVCPQAPARICVRGSWVSRGWGKEQGRLRGQPGVSQIAGNTFAGDGCCTTLIKINRRWKSWIDVASDKGSFRSTVTVKHDPYDDLWKYAILRKSQEDYFYQITYPVVYYPVFRAMELFNQRYLLHASGVNAGGKGIIFCGMEGIGKTSLVLSLLGPDVHFMSDNLLFYDAQAIYPCYETVRVHPDGGSNGEPEWQDGFERLTRFKSCKDFYVPCIRENSAGRVEPRAIVFPEFGQAFAVRELDAAAAARRAVNLSYSASELAQYAQYRRIYDIIDGGCVPEAEQFRLLTGLLGRGRSFVITMPRKDGLKANVERVRTHLAGLGFAV